MLERLLLAAEDELPPHPAASTPLKATRPALPDAAEGLGVRQLAELADPLPLAGHGPPEESLAGETGEPAVVTVTGTLLLAHRAQLPLHLGRDLRLQGGRDT